MIDLTIHTQPDDESCGPTSLHALYQYYGLDIELEQVIKGIERSHSGGTIAPMLGKHALQLNFSAIIYVNNVSLFDPTWFDPLHGESVWENLAGKLKAQMKHKTEMRFLQESQAYLEFLELGGQIRFRTLSLHLLKKYFLQNIPILTGLSATYLYRCSRELYNEKGEALYDDIRGTPCGHFVVLCGYDESKRNIVVADPHRANPISHDNYYKVSSIRLINAILLGVLTYDANLLIIQPRVMNANYNRNG
ncbi:MAG: peptidase-C39 like family protein [Tatlockia sp.]|nr:peptidase-C39 like family protein [Tatlockia sp.]